MKILTIRLKNLNSLKGEYSISFEESPLRDSGLFLITGNTGAGKSTILDAITLALFGLVPRFEDMNITKKENQILTHGSQSCYAEVEFESMGTVYRSKWSLRKTRTGSFSESKRELAELSPDRQNSKILATKKKAVDALVEELLGGLDFKRFTRSVLLAQGEFAQFLKGTKDRSTILERITNSDRYSKISIAAFERHKEAQLELEKLREQNSNIQLLSPEEKAFLVEQLSISEQQQQEQEKTLAVQQQQLQNIQKLEALKKEHVELTLQLEQLSQQKIAAQDAFDQLDLHQKAIEFKPALDELEQIIKNYQVVLGEIEALTKVTQTTKEELKQCSGQQTELETQLQEAKKDFSSFEKIYDQVVKLDTQIESETKTGASLYKELQESTSIVDTKKTLIHKTQEEKQRLLTAQINTNNWLEKNQLYASLVDSDTIFELKNHYKDLQKYEEALQAIRKKQLLTTNKIGALKTQAEQLNTSLQENQSNLKEERQSYLKLCKQYKLDPSLSYDTQLRTIQEQSANTDELLQALTSVEEERKKHQELLLQVIEIDENIDSKQTEFEFLDGLFLQYEDALNQARKLESYYESVYQDQQAKNDLSAFRGKLKEGDECPLCFSVEQPFRNLKVDISYALKKADQDRNKAKKERETVEQTYSENTNHQRLIFSNIQDLQKKKATLLNELTLVEENIGFIIEKKQLFVAPLIHKKNALKEKIADTATLVKEYVALERTLTKVHQKIQNSAKDEELIQSKLHQNALHLKDFTQQENEQHLEEAHYNKELQQTQTFIEKQLAIFQLKETLPKAIQQLEMHKNKFVEQVDWQQKQATQLENINLQLENAESQLKEAQEHLDTKTKLWEKHQENFQNLKAARLELFGEKSIQETKITKTNQLEAFHTILEDNLKKVQQLEQLQAKNTGVLSEKQKQAVLLEAQKNEKEPRLLSSIQTIGLEDLGELKASLLEKAVAQSIAQQQQELLQSMDATLEKQTTNKEQQEVVLQTLSISLDQKEALLEKYQSLQQQAKNLLQEIGSIKEKLRHQATQEEKNQTLLTKIKAYRKEVERWGMLKELIGSSDGKKFRVFAQSITLKKLIHLANQHLRYFINGRYYLEKRLAEYQDRRPNDILEIDIVDTFQANNKRPLNTLSGGESFLASLALALGLSDLAGGNATIESLFIDEGFGTLDADTLQVAIRALQTLESKGKTIGVISHIEQLKQNIPTQIHVVKKGGGFSQLKVLEV